MELRYYFFFILCFSNNKKKKIVFKQILFKYPPPPVSDERAPLAILGTNYIFTCSERLAARSISKFSQNIYIYHFDHIPSFDFWGPNFTECATATCHAGGMVLETKKNRNRKNNRKIKIKF